MRRLIRSAVIVSGFWLTAAAVAAAAPDEDAAPIRMPKGLEQSAEAKQFIALAEPIVRAFGRDRVAVVEILVVPRDAQDAEEKIAGLGEAVGAKMSAHLIRGNNRDFVTADIALGPVDDVDALAKKVDHAPRHAPQHAPGPNDRGHGAADRGAGGAEPGPGGAGSAPQRTRRPAAGPARPAAQAADAAALSGARTWTVSYRPPGW